MIDLLLLIAAVAIVCWLILMIPAVAEFRKVVIGIGLIIIVFAAIQFFFGVSVLAHLRALGSK